MQGEASEWGAPPGSGGLSLLSQQAPGLPGGPGLHGELYFSASCDSPPVMSACPGVFFSGAEAALPGQLSYWAEGRGQGSLRQAHVYRVLSSRSRPSNSLKTRAPFPPASSIQAAPSSAPDASFVRTRCIPFSAPSPRPVQHRRPRRQQRLGRTAGHRILGQRTGRRRSPSTSQPVKQS